MNTAVACAALARLPHGSEGMWALLPGAILFGVGIEVLRLITAVYFVGKIERIGDLYGSLGLAVVILAWLYLMGRLMVTGCMLNASVAYGRLSSEPVMTRRRRSTPHRMQGDGSARDHHVRRVCRRTGAVVLKELSRVRKTSSASRPMSGSPTRSCGNDSCTPKTRRDTRRARFRSFVQSEPLRP